MYGVHGIGRKRSARGRIAHGKAARRLLCATLFGVLLTTLGACSSGPSFDGPAARLKPGDPVVVRMRIGGGNGSLLTIVNKSFFLADQELETPSLPANACRHEDQDMIHLVQDFTTVGFFRIARTSPPPTGSDYVAITLPGRTEYLVNPLQGGPVARNQEWAKSLHIFNAAFNAGDRFERGSEDRFDPLEEQRRLRESVRDAQRRHRRTP